MFQESFDPEDGSMRDMCVTVDSAGQDDVASAIDVQRSFDHARNLRIIVDVKILIQAVEARRGRSTRKAFLELGPAQSFQ